MGRPPEHPVETKLKIVLSVISGETTQAEAARRHGVSETSIAKWKDQFLQAGKTGLEQPAGPTVSTGTSKSQLAVRSNVAAAQLATTGTLQANGTSANLAQYKQLPRSVAPTK